jgi:hypothetical protein
MGKFMGTLFRCFLSHSALNRKKSISHMTFCHSVRSFRASAMETNGPGKIAKERSHDVNKSKLNIIAIRYCGVSDSGPGSSKVVIKSEQFAPANASNKY